MLYDVRRFVTSSGYFSSAGVFPVGRYFDFYVLDEARAVRESVARCHRPGYATI